MKFLYRYFDIGFNPSRFLDPLGIIPSSGKKGIIYNI